MKLKITYDPKWGLALTDKRMEDELRELEEDCEMYRDTDTGISKMYGNFEFLYLTILLYVRGFIDHKDIVYIIDGEEHKLNKYGVIENYPDHYGRTGLDAALEIAMFAMKLRKQEQNKID